MIRKITAVIVFLFFVTLPRDIYAVDDLPAGKAGFASSYDVLYDVDNSGITTVTEKITLRNLTSEYYANQFKLSIGATQIFDIKASDPGGALAVSSEQKDTQTSINVKFNTQVAGLGKTLPWTITFKSKDFAEKLGKVWEVRIPKISSSTNLEAYNLTLAVPQSFNSPSSISPLPKSQTTSSGKFYLVFDKEALQASGVSASFGSNQLFDFDLTYHLENNNLMPVLTTIALPPDTPFQDVIYQRIDPKPLNITIDSDGNYLAWYRLSRTQKMDVKLVGSAKLYAKSKVQEPFLPEDLKRKYTEARKYWEKDNPQIVNKLNEILGDFNGSSDEKTKLIFRFVVNYLKYDADRLKEGRERLGALTALNNPSSAVCMEFTDLFIALTRAAGIPSRELDGYAYTANSTLRPLSLSKDVLHAWPEYWDDRRGWVMVDPTWENTTGGVDYFSKLDLNHFTFAVRGLSSSEPIPAGSYKYFANQDTHDVKVSLSENDFLGKPQIDAQIETANPIFAGFPGVIRVKISNRGNALYPSTGLGITTRNTLILNKDEQKLGPIPPFGMAEFDFNIRTKSLLDNYTDQITVFIGGQKFTKEMVIKPFILFQTVPLVIEAVLALMMLIYMVVLGGHFYQKRLKKQKSRK